MAELFRVVKYDNLPRYMVYFMENPIERDDSEVALF